MASGSTQSRGTAAMSVVMYVVAPIRRLDGTKASAIQRRYLPQLSGGSGGTPLHCSRPVASAPSDGSPTSGSDRRRQSVSAHSTISIGANVAVTPLARDKAREMKLEIVRDRP